MTNCSYCMGILGLFRNRTPLLPVMVKVTLGMVRMVRPVIVAEQTLAILPLASL